MNQRLAYIDAYICNVRAPIMMAQTYIVLTPIKVERESSNAQLSKACYVLLSFPGIGFSESS